MQLYLVNDLPSQNKMLNLRFVQYVSIAVFILTLRYRQMDVKLIVWINIYLFKNLLKVSHSADDIAVDRSPIFPVGQTDGWTDAPK